MAKVETLIKNIVNQAISNLHTEGYDITERRCEFSRDYDVCKVVIHGPSLICQYPVYVVYHKYHGIWSGFVSKRRNAGKCYEGERPPL